MQTRWLVFAAWVGLAACSKSSNGATPDAPLDPGDAATAPDASPVCSPPMEMCGATCTNLSTDASNCGACGHVCGCGSTSCTDGVCDSHVMAGQQGAPVTLALNNGALYWGTDVDLSLETMPVTGTTATALYKGRTAIRGFAFDATRVYFTRTNFNIVESGLLSGASSGNFSNAQEIGATGIATDGTTVFWTTNGSGNLRSAPVGALSTATTLLANLSHPDAIALDAANIYFTTNNTANQQPPGTIMKLAKTATGGPATTLVTKQNGPHSLAVAGGYVYWINQGDGTPNTGSVNRIAVTGGAITTYAGQLPGPTTIAVDASYIYWTDSVAGAVMRIPIAPVAGATPTPVAVRELTPIGLAVSSSCLYFTDYADGAAGNGSVRSHDLD
jgi:sugar lactone lactonase YvrE